MKISELSAKTTDQLETLLLDLKKEAFNLRFQKLNGVLEKPSRIRVVRRTVARVKTLLNKKEAGSVKASKKKNPVKKKTKKSEVENA